LDSNLLLLLRRENVDDSLYGGGGGVGVHGAEHQVTGFSCLDGDGKAFRIAHFPDHDDIRRLPEYVSQSLMKRVCVHSDLSLVHVTAFMLVQVLDGIFDGDDVAMPLPVNTIQKGCKGSRLSMPRRAGDENEPLGFKGIILDPGG
jgi:hypothetical protein